MARYLVVDDSPTIRAVLRASLEKALQTTADLTEASSPGEGVAVFERTNYDLVFLDMMMNDDTAGLRALQDMLRKRPTARIVLMTSLPVEHPDVVRAIGLGAFAHLQKPLRVDKVANLLAELVGEDSNVRRIR